MYKLRSMAFVAYFLLWGSVLALIMLLCQPFGFSLLKTLKRLWIRGILWGAARFLSLRYKISGLENLPHGPSIIAMKHQSAWDAFIPGLILSNPGYVLKKELLSIPLFGSLLKRWPMVALDRQASTKAMRDLLSQAKTLFQTRKPQLVIFPEGTRTAPGATADYKPGVALLYEALHVPIVPVALNSGLYWGRGWSNFKPGTIELVILPAIEPGLPRSKAFKLMKERIEEKSLALAEAA